MFKNTGIKIDIIESKMNENKMSGPIVIPASVRTSKNKSTQAVRPMGNKLEVPDVVANNAHRETKNIIKKKSSTEPVKQSPPVAKEVSEPKTSKPGMEDTKIVKKKVVMPDGSVVIKKLE